MAERFDNKDQAWPQRPWIMSVVGAACGLIVHLLTDGHGGYGQNFPVWRQAATAFTVVATIAFLLTVELRRWPWAIGFAVGWGAVIALIGWFTAQYNRMPEIMEFPFLSGILAVLIAAPLFQTARDESAWRFPYERLHRHAWTDAVIGAASLFFTGITFLLAWLIASLFDVIGIEAIKDLLQEEWFGWMLAGLAFGGAVGILRERDALVATLQKLVMVVLAVLAPVLAVALAAFLLSLPFTGLGGLWESDIPATPMLLLSGAGAILLVNAVIGDGRDDHNPNIWLYRAALVLVICVLPLAILAALSMGQRIGQYGWTPERIWGVVAVGIAIAYGVAAWWAAFKGRIAFDDRLRPLQTKLAIGLCGLALFLALPILDFGAISARSQLARLNNGEVTAEQFDWRAMAFDFGPEGRKRLKAIAEKGAPDARPLAGQALKATDRYDVEVVEQVKTLDELEHYLRKVPADLELTSELRRAVANASLCRERPCILVKIADDRMALAGRYHENGPVDSMEFRLLDGKWQAGAGRMVAKPVAEIDLVKGHVEIRTIERRQLFIDGNPVGEDME